MKKHRIIVNGAKGKMGVLACQAIQQHPEFELVAQLGSSDNLPQTITQTQADIVVDLNRADCAYKNTLAIINAGARPIIGTSGLQAAQISTLSQQCEQQQLGGIIVPNFSISAVLMMHFASIAATFIPHAEIIEMHHPAKLDAPSGTAVKTAELITKHRKKGQDVPIHSLRLPGVLARQEVLFGSLGETLSIVHESIDRLSFMPGLILACSKVMELNRLYYGLEHILF